jgi:two-component sensor histidine kinase
VASQVKSHSIREDTVPDSSSRLQESILQSQPAPHVDELASDWELVLRETNHRMKNTLTLLGVSVRREFTRGGANGLSHAVDRIERRVAAFARLYQILSGDAEHKVLAVADFFASLCGALSEAILEPAGIRCEAMIDSGTLPAAQCHRLGLMITELVTNAARHAFPGGRAGHIRIEALKRNDHWYCTIADNGVGACGSLQGTGGRILERLAQSIGAEIHGNSGRLGTSVTIVAPALD